MGNTTVSGTMRLDTLANSGQPSTHHSDWPLLARHAEFQSTTPHSMAPMYSAAAPPGPVAVSAPHSARSSSAVSQFNGAQSAAATTWANPPMAHVTPLHTADALPRISPHPADTLYLRAGKRFLDVVGALLALIVTSPLMLLAALLIKIESRGPILYKSTRLGWGGKPFTFLKLRSMVNDAHQKRHHVEHLNECDGPVFKISNDPRVTRVGRLLRRTSIDELPQLFNVLRGDMTLVGPRPPIPEEVRRYEPWQLKRLSVRPGLTCLWQISGRSRIGFQEWMRLDLEYIRHQSLAMDLKILVRTIPAVVSRDGAY